MKLAAYARTTSRGSSKGFEIKSRPGVVSGDAHTWLWVTDGRERACDNPLILANRKAKRLASLLRRQSSVAKVKVRLPFVEPLVFLSASSLNCKLGGTARAGAYLRGQPGSDSDPGIIGALHNVHQRLQIVRDLAETLKYAHQKRLYHRALCPQSVLIQNLAGTTPRPRIMNWQTGAREGTQSSDTIDPARRTVGGTLHV